MPVYKLEVKGAAKASIVKASSAAKARDHVVAAKALSAEELVEELSKGAEIETAAEQPAETGEKEADEG